MSGENNKLPWSTLIYLRSNKYRFPDDGHIQDNKLNSMNQKPNNKDTKNGIKLIS